MGRPSEFTQEIADRICEGIADGKSLRSICLAEDMPNKATVFRWLAAHTAFSDQYARAREAQADTLADELTDIADDSARDFIQTENGPAYNAEHVNRSRLRVDTRKWIASKLKPKKYGEKVQQELSGPSGGPIEAKIVIEHVRP